MSDEGDGKAAGGGERSAGSADRPRRKWPILFFGVSIVLMVLGLALMGYVAVTDRGGEEPASSGVATPAEGVGELGESLVRGFLPTEGGEGEGGGGETLPREGATSDPLADWSPAIFRLGFSFFAGFAIAYAVRRFIKIAVFASGLVILVLFGLQYGGVIDVNWESISDHWDTLMARGRDEASTFTQFIQGYLPSTASAALGLVAGFRR